jgi:pimeloyl-ACP methyl ester carboxylesterase
MLNRFPGVTVFGALCASLLCGVSARAETCTTISQYALPDTVVTSAEMIPAGKPEATPPMPPANFSLPEHCKVAGKIHQRIGADKEPYAIEFELRLPGNWNGKFLFQGGGGLDGVVRPATGMTGFGISPALARGYAVVSTDAGHQGVSNSRFGKEQQARLDYAYQAIGEVTKIAKEILTRYYAMPASHSYFVGCSNGGRQGLMAAQRFPLEFDGVVAGDPGFRLSHAAIGEAWDTETFNSIAEVDASGCPILSKAYSAAEMELIGKAILDQCDALDGIKDGEINNQAACKFDPEVLVCKQSGSTHCLSRKQVDALKRSFNGAHTTSGEALYSSWPYDAGVSSMAWRSWKLGMSETAESDAANVTLGVPSLRDYFVHPFVPDLDPSHLNYDKIAAQVEETHVINDATSTDYGTFAARGGRVIVYQGMSDPVFSADDLIQYYDRFIHDNGGVSKAQSVARLFLIPGMAHCGMGPATDQFDALTELEQWVEKDQAPQRILATGRAFPGRTRPLCPYPQYASYVGTGNPEDAANFVCK